MVCIDIHVSLLAEIVHCIFTNCILQYLCFLFNSFFSLELPRYSKYETLRDKLQYAINHAISIDTDYNARPEELDRE